jgi:hypothetical protein
MNIETNYLSNNKSPINNLENITYNLMEVSNLYPNNLQKINIRPEQRQLISYLRHEAYSICRTTMHYDYIKASFNKFKNGFVYYKDKLPIAFCIWKVREYLQFSGTFKELYIYLICGKQLDYKLVPRIIDDVVNLCRKSNIQYISLEPANDSLKEYYIKCGFKERCGINNSKLLDLDVNNARIISKGNKIYKSKTRKIRRMLSTLEE